MGKIVWIASYPKSGNTWLRALLASLRNGGAPVDINGLHSTNGAPDRHRFDEVLGIDSADLTSDEVECLRPRVYEAVATNVDDLALFKIHDAFHQTPAGEWIAPPSVTHGAIYPVRHPYAVAPSFANHLGVSLKRAVEVMNDREYAFAPGDHAGAPQVRQRLLDWSGHAESWLAAPFPVHVVRYEDLHESPARELAKVAEFLGWTVKPGVVRRAVSAARFDRLKSQERKAGFREAPPGRTFFRRGEADSWKKELPPALARSLSERHAATMQRFGYRSEIS
jgi:aryl sulfotransferase